MSVPHLETEWYLRDYLFRQGKLGRRIYSPEDIASEMSRTYLRYKGFSPESLLALQVPAFDSLVRLGVVDKSDQNCYRLASELVRLRCAKCFYVSYISAAEPRKCLRCSLDELYDFPKKK